MPPMSGVIFDLDGTLLNTLESLARCFNRVLTQLSFPTHEVDAYRYFIGDGARQCVIRSLPETARDDKTVDHMLALQQQDYLQHWQDDVTIYDGVTPLLQSLNNGAYKLAVLSNKDDQFTQRCVKHFFPTGTFDLIHGAGPDIPHKPNPIGALSIAKHWGIAPQNLAFVGDTAMDIETAVRSNMLPIGVLWGFREKAELREAGASHFVAHPMEIPPILTGTD